MEHLTWRVSRAVLGWCYAYTLLVPRDAARRRRAEITSHLYEYERCPQARAGLVLRHWARGVAADLVWAARGGACLAGRGLQQSDVWLGIGGVAVVALGVATAFEGAAPWLHRAFVPLELLVVTACAVSAAIRVFSRRVR